MRRPIRDQTLVVLDDITEGVANIFSGTRESDVRDEAVVWDNDNETASGKVRGDVGIDKPKRLWGYALLAGVKSPAIYIEEYRCFGGLILRG